MVLAAACSDPAIQSLQAGASEGIGPVPLTDQIRRSGAALRLNEVQQKATHNSYERDEPLIDQLLYHGVRALELDLHATRLGRRSAPQDWYVYHVLPSPNDTSCRHLSDCLKMVKAFHNVAPRHEVVTLWLDLKDALSGAGHAADDLDAAIGSLFEREAVLRPADLLRRCPTARSLREAVTGECAWPTLEELRGKIVFALTGATACERGSVFGDYAARALQRVAFLAPSVDASCPFGQEPAAARDTVFFNMDAESSAQASVVHAAGFIGRVYGGGVSGGLDDKGSWDRARGRRAHYLATDRVNVARDRWATTTTRSGWPFASFFGDDDAPSERAELVDLVVDTMDIEGRADSFYFLEPTSRVAANGGDERSVTWRAAIGTAGSHVERFAKGCLMARATEDADSPYFAVCRPASRGPTRVQYRLSRGGPTLVVKAPPLAGVSPEGAAFASLRVVARGEDTVVSGSLSGDGVTFVPIASRVFNAPLPRQGLAASSHGALGVRFVFGGVERNAERVPATAFEAHRPIGARATGRVRLAALEPEPEEG